MVIHFSGDQGRQLLSPWLNVCFIADGGFCGRGGWTGESPRPRGTSASAGGVGGDGVGGVVGILQHIKTKTQASTLVCKYIKNRDAHKDSHSTLLYAENSQYLLAAVLVLVEQLVGSFGWQMQMEVLATLEDERITLWDENGVEIITHQHGMPMKTHSGGGDRNWRTWRWRWSLSSKNAWSE